MIKGHNNVRQWSFTHMHTHTVLIDMVAVGKSTRSYFWGIPAPISQSCPFESPLVVDFQIATISIQYISAENDHCHNFYRLLFYLEFESSLYFDQRSPVK